MIRNWHRRILSLASGLAAATLLIAFAAPAASAQTTETTALKSVRIWVNPEYDDSLKLNVPALLVMMEGQVAGASGNCEPSASSPTTERAKIH